MTDHVKPATTDNTNPLHLHKTQTTQQTTHIQGNWMFIWIWNTLQTVYNQ